MSVRHIVALSAGGSLLLLMPACGAPDRSAKPIPQAESAAVASISAQAKSLRAQQPPRPGLDLVPRERASSSPPTALLVSPRHLPAGLDLTTWCRDLAKAGVTAIVLDAWTAADHRKVGDSARRRSGLYFRSELGPLVQDLLGPLVPAARSQGLALYASVGFRAIDWLDSNLGWTLSVYDSTRQAFQRSEEMDLLHPAYQDFLGGLLKDLAATGVTGIVIRADGAVGPASGVSMFALKGFERDFGFQPDVREIVGSNGNDAKRPPVYWQWVGWVTREQQHALDRLANGLARQWPDLKVILEVHPEAVVSPIQGLVRYGEDVLEARRGRYAAFMVSDVGARKENLLPKLKEMVGGSDRVWVLLPLPWGSVVQTGQPGLSAIRERDARLGESGVVYAVGSPALP